MGGPPPAGGRGGGWVSRRAPPATTPRPSGVIASVHDREAGSPASSATSARSSERLDRIARELVRALVQRVAAVAAYLVPDDVVALGLGEQPLPEVAVGDGLPLAVLPAALLPALPPALAKAVHDVRAVRVQMHTPPARDRREAFDGRGELHALIRGVRLGTADDVLLAGVKDDRRPAAGTRVPGAGAVGVDDDTASGRLLGPASGPADSCQ